MPIEGIIPQARNPGQILSDSSDSYLKSMLQNKQINISQQEADRAKMLLPYQIQQLKDAHIKAPWDVARLQSEIQESIEKIKSSQTGRKIGEKVFGLDQNGNPVDSASKGASSVQNAPVNSVDPLNSIPSGPVADPSTMQSTSMMDNLMNPGAANQSQFPASAPESPFANTPVNPQAAQPPMFGLVQNGMGNNQNPFKNSTIAPPVAPPPPQIAPMQPAMTDANAKNYAGAPSTLHGLPISAFQQDNVMAQPQSATPNNTPQAAEQAKAQTIPNDEGEIQVTPPTKGMEGRDLAPGSKIWGIDIPAIWHDQADGYEFTHYPSGKVMKRKIGPDEQEKQDIKTAADKETELYKNTLETSSKKDVSEYTSNLSEAKALNQQALPIVQIKNYAQELKTLLEKNPRLTGIVNGALAASNISDSKDLAKFNAISGKMQVASSHIASSRGGVGITKLVGNFKPGIWKQGNYNLGLIDSVITDAKSDYALLNKTHKNLVGKDLPTPFDQGKNWVIDPVTHKWVEG